MPEYEGQQFKEKLTPETEKRMLQEKIAQSPEAVKEIIKAHTEQIPERVFESSYMLTEEQRQFLKNQLSDPAFAEKNEKIGYFLSMVDAKGVLPVVSVIKDEDPALIDQLHDILVQYFKTA